MIESTRLRPGLTAAFVAAMLLTFGAGPAAAGSANTTMNATATVLNSCKFSVTDLAFGNYVGDADVFATFTASATCAAPTSLALAVGPGLHVDALDNRRRMQRASATDLLKYKLYADSGHTAELVDNISIKGNTTSFPLTLYGVIASGQTALAGSYSDTVTWTLTW